VPDPTGDAPSVVRERTRRSRFLALPGAALLPEVPRVGEVASRLAIATLVNIVLHVPDWIQRLDEEHAHELMDRAASYYRRVNAALLERARVDPSLHGMGTTMTAAYSVGDDLFVANVGDSRAYLCRDGKLQLLTRDQTQAQMLADAGVIQQSEVAKHRLRHVLTNALGGSVTDVRVDVERLKLTDGDRLLMCTDGLTDMLDDADIAERLRTNADSERACQALVAGDHEGGAVGVVGLGGTVQRGGGTRKRERLEAPFYSIHRIIFHR